MCLAGCVPSDAARSSDAARCSDAARSSDAELTSGILTWCGSAKHSAAAASPAPCQLAAPRLPLTACPAAASSAPAAEGLPLPGLVVWLLCPLSAQALPGSGVIASARPLGVSATVTSVSPASWHRYSSLQLAHAGQWLTTPDGRGVWVGGLGWGKGGAQGERAHRIRARSGDLIEQPGW